MLATTIALLLATPNAGDSVDDARAGQICAVHLASPEGAGLPDEEGEVLLAPDGSRTMHRTAAGMRMSYAITPTRDKQGTITGEIYAAASDDAPMLKALFTRDRKQRLMREVLERPAAADESNLMAASRVVGWYDYDRDPKGRLLGVTAYVGPGSDQHWFGNDDQLGYRITFQYASGLFRSAEVQVPGSTQGTWAAWDAFRFRHDNTALLVGASELGHTFAIDCVPRGGDAERVLVLVLSPHGGPGHAFTFLGPDGVIPRPPR